jgi:hypothetical protein
MVIMMIEDMMGSWRKDAWQLCAVFMSLISSQNKRLKENKIRGLEGDRREDSLSLQMAFSPFF